MLTDRPKTSAAKAESLSRAALEALDLAEAEERVNQLQAHFDSLAFEAEEKLGELEQGAEMLRQLALVPDAGQSSAEVLGPQHPSVLLEAKRNEVLGQLDALEPETDRADDYGLTLVHVLDRAKREKVLLTAAVQEMRVTDEARSRDFHALQLLAAEARGAASAAIATLRQTQASQQRNAVLYAEKVCS